MLDRRWQIEQLHPELTIVRGDAGDDNTVDPSRAAAPRNHPSPKEKRLAFLHVIEFGLRRVTVYNWKKDELHVGVLPPTFAQGDVCSMQVPLAPWFGLQTSTLRPTAVRVLVNLHMPNHSAQVIGEASFVLREAGLDSKGAGVPVQKENLTNGRKENRKRSRGFQDEVCFPECPASSSTSISRAALALQFVEVHFRFPNLSAHGLTHTGTTQNELSGDAGGSNPAQPDEGAFALDVSIFDASPAEGSAPLTRRLLVQLRSASFRI
jgi:hypothetical protein